MKSIIVWVALLLIGLMNVCATEAQTRRTKAEFALFDGVFNFDGGNNEFLFGARLSRNVTDSFSAEGSAGFIPNQQGRDALLWNVNLLYHVIPPVKSQNYPGIFPFAVAGIGAVNFFKRETETRVAFSVGAGAKIFTSRRLGFRADFREHFYRKDGELWLNLEASGGILFRF